MACAVQLLRLVLRVRRLLPVGELVRIHLVDLDRKVLANSTSASRQLATLRRGATHLWAPRCNRRCHSSCRLQRPNRDSSWRSHGSIAVLVVHSHRKHIFTKNTFTEFTKQSHSTKISCCFPIHIKVPTPFSPSNIISSRLWSGIPIVCWQFKNFERLRT